MKERYIAPELNLLCFAPVEKLASQGINIFDFEDLLDAAGKGSAVIPDIEDIFTPVN